MAPKSAFWFGSVHTGYIGTGALLVPGFGTQPYSSASKRTRSIEHATYWDFVLALILKPAFMDPIY